MSAKHKLEFLKRYGFTEPTTLSLEQLSSLTGIPHQALQIIHDRGEVIERTPAKVFSFHKERKTKPKGKGMERVWRLLTKRKGWEEDEDVAGAFGLFGLLEQTLPSGGRMLAKVSTKARISRTARVEMRLEDGNNLSGVCRKNGIVRIRLRPWHRIASRKSHRT